MLTRRRCVQSLLLASPVLKAAPLPGSVLVHEHILVDFTPAATFKPYRYDRDEVVRAARPHLEAVRKLGCRRLQECTPNWLGRDPILLRTLADLTGVEIWTNTGLYAARDRQHLPDYAVQESAEQLARRFEREARQGVEGLKPRFIKIGVNGGPLHPLDRKIVEAAALAARETGLTIAAHTGDGKAAREELEVVTARKVPARQFVWVHAQSEKDQTVHEELARAGAWVEFDGVGPQSLDWHRRCVTHLGEKGLLGRVLVSHDAGWYHVGEPGGGTYRGYTTVYDELLPALKPEWGRMLLVENPVAAFGK